MHRLDNPVYIVGIARRQVIVELIFKSPSSSHLSQGHRHGSSSVGGSLEREEDRELELELELELG